MELSGGAREDELGEAMFRCELWSQVIVSIPGRYLSFGFLHQPPFLWLKGIFLASPLIPYLSSRSSPDLKGPWRLWYFRVIRDKTINRGTCDLLISVLFLIWRTCAMSSSATYVYCIPALAPPTSIPSPSSSPNSVIFFPSFLKFEGHIWDWCSGRGFSQDFEGLSLDFFDSWRGVENIIQPFLRTQTAGRTKPQRVLYSLGVGSGPREGLSLNTGPCEPVSKTGN